MKVKSMARWMGVIILVGVPIYGGSAQAGLLDLFEQALVNQVTSQFTHLAGDAINRLTDGGLNQVREDVMSGIFGQDDSQQKKAAQENQGELGIPDPSRTNAQIEETLNQEPVEPRGVGDPNAQLAMQQYQQEARLAGAVVYTDTELSQENQAFDRQQLQAVTRLAQAAQDSAQRVATMTVTQDIVRESAGLDAIMVQNQAAMLSNQQRLKTTQTLALGRLNEIARNTGILANRQQSGVSANTASFVSRAATSTALFNPSEAF